MNSGSLAVIFAPNLLRPAVEPSAMQVRLELFFSVTIRQAPPQKVLCGNEQLRTALKGEKGGV